MSKNKDEEIKLYLSAITTRDPSKRQIKPVDKDAFQLFDDLESGSDEDFVVGSDDLSDDHQLESEENVSSEEEDNDEAKKSPSISNSSKSQDIGDEKMKNDMKLDHLDKYSNDVKLASKTKIENVMICMMCLLDASFSDNEIIECDGCGIVVHEDCYKISDSVFMSCDASDASTDPWFCDACLTNVQEPRCELCPVEGGVFKRTENNRWVHLLCALYTPGVAFNDIDNLSEITLSELPIKEWSARECSICPNPFYARTGVCISCDAGLCKNVFHVLCAQKEGLLSEPNNEENSDDPYFANCRQHTDKEVSKRRKKNWNAARNRQKLRLEEWYKNDHFNDSRLIRKREYFATMYNKYLDIVPPPFVPMTKVPCYLETNPVAVFFFKKKATNLRLSQEVLNSQTSSDSKIVTSGIPVFGPDFISYFLDREKKIDETTLEIVKLEGHHRELQISEQNTSHQFNTTVAKKESIAKTYKDQLDSLNMKFELIKKLVKNRELVEVIGNLMNRFESPNNNGSGNGDDSVRSCADKDINSNNKTGPRNDSVINECYMCKSVSDQHLLIDCDKCHKFVHIGCLDPPLTRMPRKTKLYGWQCSRCASESSEEEQKKTVDVNRPRQLRKSSDIRSKYSRVEEISITKQLGRRLLQKTRQRSIVNRTRSKSMGDKPAKPEPSKSTKPTEPVQPAEQLKTAELKLEAIKIEKSPVKPVAEDRAPETVQETETEDVPKPLLGQRKSDRARKRPITLLDEYETTVSPKRSKFHKAIKSMERRNRKSMSLKRGPRKLSRRAVSQGHDESMTVASNQSVDTSDHKSLKQPITFYPSSEASISSKNSAESEQVQIGVVAKKLSTLVRDSLSGAQKSLEKKSILIKCHDDQDDDRMDRFSGNNNNNNGKSSSCVDI